MSASYDEVMASLGLEPSTPKQTAIKHGDRRGYSRGCRCPECREAWRAYCAARRAEKRTDPTAADRAKHGKAATYRVHGCRCDACRAANTADVAAYRARRRERAKGQASRCPVCRRTFEDCTCTGVTR
ncbi:hypothetical protein [Streptomyces sp. BBFR109]|uniref:hypothetical protein n=1 Tax=Streptomyces sp. BBFR109 TaxID=3448172 RepID=UPI003F76D0BF